MGQAPGPSPIPGPVPPQGARARQHRLRAIVWALGMFSARGGLHAEACAHTRPPCACAWVCAWVAWQPPVVSGGHALGSTAGCQVVPTSLSGKWVVETGMLRFQGSLPEQPSEEVIPALAQGAQPPGPLTDKQRPPSAVLL